MHSNMRAHIHTHTHVSSLCQLNQPPKRQQTTLSSSCAETGIRGCGVQGIGDKYTPMLSRKGDNHAEREKE